MCTLRLSIDINSVAVILHLELKPRVEFVCKKLDNALEIMCSLRLSIRYLFSSIYTSFVVEASRRSCS